MAVDVSTFIITCSLISLAWAYVQFSIVAATKLDDGARDEERSALKGGKSASRQQALLKETYEAISTGAEAFLYAEYTICAVFVLAFGIIVFTFISW
eukprot:gene43116-52695_t